jgi:hypothetical protein
VLPGEAQPPAAPAPHGAAAPTLPTLRPQATAAELRVQAAELEAEALQALQALAEIPALASSAADVRSMARQLTARATELRAVAASRAARAEAQALAAPALPTLRADAAAGRPVSLAALQGERVGILWPISQALTGAGVALPPTWQHGGPVLDGTVPLAHALATLPLGAIATAAAALAALPPVTAAQDAALAACRTGAVPGRPYL